MKTHRQARFAALSGLLVSSLLLLGVAPAQGQTMDARWLPWVGCWEPVDSLGGGSANGPMLCFRPVAGQSGVEMLSVQGDKIVSHRMIQADQTRRESQEGCSGTTRAQFSSDGRRVFTVSDLQCQGGVARKTTGIMSLTSPAEWLDVKSLEVGGKTTPWVVRYQLASPDRMDAAGLGDVGANLSMAIESARMAAAAPIDINDVVEASKVVDPDALKAWIAERGNRFDLNAANLVRLKKAGVQSDVIDVMVAVTYPQKFALNGSSPHPQEAPPVRGNQGYYGRQPMYAGCDPFFWDPYCFGYGYYGYGMFSPYSYFGGYYGGWGLGGGYYGGGYVPVIINPQPTAPSSGYQHGRMVRGQGYVPGASAGSSSSSSPRTATRGSENPPRSGRMGTPRIDMRPPPPSRAAPSAPARTAHRRGGGGR